MSLEWRTPEHEDDFVRYPVYAGKVPAVQRVRKLQVRDYRHSVRYPSQTRRRNAVMCLSVKLEGRT